MLIIVDPNVENITPQRKRVFCRLTDFYDNKIDSNSNNIILLNRTGG